MNSDAKRERVNNIISPHQVESEVGRLDYIDYNPFKGIKQFSEPQKEKMIFTEKERNKFLDGIDKSLFKNLVLIDMYTGLRLSEVLNLQWKDVLLEERLLKIVNKDNHTTKTGKIRTIPISDKLFVLLKTMSSKVNGGVM